MKNRPGYIGHQAGVTLAELMIAVALIGVGILAIMGSFNVVHQAIQSSKTGTLASNLAQEKMQIIMQQTYYQILVTTNTVYDTDFSPNVPYDTGYFPPETVLQGGVTFTRLTNIQVVQSVNGVIQTLPASTPDTGMRQITVNVVWQSYNGKHIMTIQNIINNPNTVMSNASIIGQVTDATTGSPISLALVDVAENIGWRNNTDATGHYTLNVSPGNFHLTASALGYFPAIFYLAIPPNGAPVNQPITLTPISTGTISGTAWLDNHLVISQVVASTGSANDIEYVELYNPTTSAILMGTNSPSATNVWPIIWDATGSSFPRALYYVNTTIPSYGFYMIANTGQASDPATSCNTFTIAGAVIAPDACWLHVIYPNHAIECTNGAVTCPPGGSPTVYPNAGGISMGNVNSVSGGTLNAASWPGNSLDSVGWSSLFPAAPCPASAAEGTCIGMASGFGTAYQLVRLTSPLGASNGQGRAYDANNNSTDFSTLASVVWTPYTTANLYPPISGTPAVGANVSVTDGISSSVKAVQTGTPPYAQFTVPGVATGTWTTFVDSGTSSAEIDNIAVTANATTSIPNASTSPTWPTVGVNAVILSTQGLTGIISGNILTVLNTVIPAPGVNVGIAGQTYPVNAITGHYSVRLPTGTYDVTANPSLGNAAYETQTITGNSVTLGDETTNINFQLAQGGKLSGWVTRDGTNPLPGVTVTALDANGDAHDTEVSANNGSFTLINLTTGVYTVEPSLDSNSTSSPGSNTGTVVAGTNVSVGTFTVTGAMGTVTGTVQAGGGAIQSGVLIVISTTSVALPPPAISSNTLTGAVYYNGSSQENGTYSVQVRGSTSTVYNVVGLYMHMSGNTPIMSTQTITGVTVTAGQTTSGENFSW